MRSLRGEDIIQTFGKRLAFARKDPSFIMTGWKMEIIGTDISRFSDIFGGKMMDGVPGNQGHIYLYT